MVKNCVDTVLLSQTKTKNKVVDYYKDCQLCADCFDKNDVTPAPGNGQGGSNPLGTSKVKGKIQCTDWLHTTTYYVMYVHTCGPCYYYKYGYIYNYYTEKDCGECQSQEDFKCPDGQYAGGYYNC